MRLRTFTGRTMTEAMAKVRIELGDDAIIVATEEDDDGSMRLTAALDQSDPFATVPADAYDVVDILGDALSGHGLSPALVEKILAAALPFDAHEPVDALSRALELLYDYAPLPADGQRRVIMLVGPPGAGKTVTTAKLATRAVIAGKKVQLVTADASRAGGIEQLDALAAILKLRVATVDHARRLTPIAAATAPDELTIIDSPGINPFNAADRRELGDLIASGGAEPILVLPAGGDIVDSLEMARIFRDLGCTRFIATRLDMVRRLGSIVAVADEMRFGFAEAGVAPAIAKGIVPFTPVTLARLLLPRAVESQRPSFAQRGVP